MITWQTILDAKNISRSDCERFDQDDPLAEYRSQFSLPPGLIYLDGNSLGALPKSTPSRIQHVIEHEWGNRLIASWNESDWFHAQKRVGEKIAPLLGAEPNEVIVSDSTSVNLYKLLVSALLLQHARSENQRRVILSDTSNFPTDIYIAQSACRCVKNSEVVQVSPESLIDAINEETAVVFLSHVDFKSGALSDMSGITQAAHDAGALVLWDVAHSAGALELRFNEWNVDLAVGCGYKYLNGGPGAPSFIFAAERHLASLDQPLTGWFGHHAPFEFTYEFKPADGIERFQAGTPSILSLASLETAMDLWRTVSINDVRVKSLALSELMLKLTREMLHEFGVTTTTPTSAEKRGSHVALHHSEGFAIVQAAIAKGVIGDFRPPDLMRFGIAPLYVGYADTWDAVDTLRQVCKEECWNDPRFQTRSEVT